MWRLLLHLFRRYDCRCQNLKNGSCDLATPLFLRVIRPPYARTWYSLLVYKIWEFASKKFWTSVNVWQSYRKCGVFPFLGPCNIQTSQKIIKTISAWQPHRFNLPINMDGIICRQCKFINCNVIMLVVISFSDDSRNTANTILCRNNFIYNHTIRRRYRLRHVNTHTSKLHYK